jgi:hypothetical protein
MAILILAIFALVITLEATGHVVFRGRLILLRGDWWLLMWWSPGVRASRAGFVLRPVQLTVFLSASAGAAIIEL